MSKRGRKQFATAPSSPFTKSPRSSKTSHHPYGDDWPLISLQVRKRDNYTCQSTRIGLPKCSKRFPPPFHHLLHVHHIRPRSKGGTNDLRNLVTLCLDCHNLEHKHMNGNRGVTQKQKFAAARLY